jgi:hypothetical protein
VNRGDAAAGLDAGGAGDGASDGIARDAIDGEVLGDALSRESPRPGDDGGAHSPPELPHESGEAIDQVGE